MQVQHSPMTPMHFSESLHQTSHDALFVYQDNVEKEKEIAILNHRLSIK